jgi:acetylornithine deacetylase/succinyl-diaminopimelate desuccinylase-like protein
VLRTIRTVVADSTIEVTGPGDARAAPMVPAPAALMRTVASVARGMWGPVAVETGIATFGTDGAALRTAGVPSFGVNGLFVDADDPADMRPHGLDERIGVKAFHDQLEFAYRLVKAL